MTPSRAERVLSRLEQFGTRLGLETTHRVLETMANPHLGFATVLVAGTNGKGSVSAMLAAIGSAAGYRTGLFTSPHLESVTERLRVDGRSIATGDLGKLLEDVEERAQTATGGAATYFESLFIAACQWFSEVDVELGVFEVGLGGRLDATNVCAPEISIITEVDLEHREQLGDTVAKIAREKAGILRSGRPCVLGARNQAAVESIERVARATGASVRLATEQVEILDALEGTDWTQHVGLRSDAGEYGIHLPLAGDHQIGNLVTAVAAAETLRDEGWARIDKDAVETGVANCVWPGRLERVTIDGWPMVVLDAAHNPGAANALAEFLAGRLAGFTLLFGALSDKDVDQMLPRLSAIARATVLTRPGSARGREPSELLQWSECPSTEVVRPPEEALERALNLGAPVVVCGSLYLVGAARSLLRDRFGSPPSF